MASRRVPLSNLPNGANSPFRGSAAVNKRARSNSGLEDVLHDQVPPSKKHANELGISVSRTPQKQSSAPLARRAEGGAVDRRQQAAKQKQSAAPVGRQEQVGLEAKSLEDVRQWQRHYLKIFPTFVFYFESVPRDSKLECVRSLRALGAREVLFFSREVTHVITTRTVPLKSDRTASPTSTAATADSASQQDDSDHRTINPSLLDRNKDGTKGGLRSKFDFEASLGRRAASNAPPQAGSVRRQQIQQVDILQRAKEMGIKTWQLEKLQRVIGTLMEGEDQHHGHNTRSQAVSAIQASKASKEPTLEDVLREDAKRRTRERDMPQCTEDILPFKGPYIYVYDVTEKTKPIMVREYKKVERREDGDWPQFRLAGQYKCPFIEDESYHRSFQAREPPNVPEGRPKRKAKAEDQQENQQPVADPEPQMQPPEKLERKRPLTELEHGANTRAPRPAPQQLPPQPSCFGPSAEASGRSRFVPPQAPAGNFVLGEPMASGLQASNITSAIRSQMVSSTAAAPGAKAGTSREIHGLQRKVLERNSGPLLSGLGASTATSSRVPPAQAARAPAPERVSRSNPRAAKQKAQERIGGVGATVNLAQIYEDPTDSDDDARKAAAEQLKQTKAPKVVRRDPKPGYCENCREKFDDFDEHVLARRHRKFATDKENWKELDELLKQLVRPGRSDDD